MSLATLIRRMSDAGAPPEAIALAIEEIEAIRALLDARRLADRDRKRAQREAQKSANVLGQSEDSRGTVGDNPEPGFLDKKEPQTPEKIKPSRVCESRARLAPPPGVTAEQWQAFRMQRKKPLNDRSYILLCNKLTELAEAGWPPGDMIDLAIERGWETVFRPRDQGNDQRSMGRHQPSDGLSATTRAARDVFGLGAGPR